MLSRFLVALIATETSTLKVVGILVDLKATVTEEGRKVVDPQERKILNVADPLFSQCGGSTCEGE